MTPFQFHTPRSVICEAGAAARLGALAGPLPGRRVLCATDPGIVRLGRMTPAVKACALPGPRCACSIRSKPT